MLQLCYYAMAAYQLLLGPFAFATFETQPISKLH